MRPRPGRLKASFLLISDEGDFSGELVAVVEGGGRDVGGGRFREGSRRRHAVGCDAVRGVRRVTRRVVRQNAA